MRRTRRRNLGCVGLVVTWACLLCPAIASAGGGGYFTETNLMFGARAFPAAAPLVNGDVLVAGGGDRFGAGPISDKTEIFDPHTAMWSMGPQMLQARLGPAAAALPDGRILIVGGSNASVGGGGGALATTELLDSMQHQFVAGPSMGTPRDGPTATLLSDGRVLVAGGSDGASVLQSAELFDPATSSFTPVGQMLYPRQNAAAARLPDGRVLVIGGNNHGGGNTTDIFDPATKSFSLGPDLPRALLAPTASPLPDGRILIVGGTDSGSSQLIFDPATRTFSANGIGAYPHPGIEGPASAPLQDGRVLVAGGQSLADAFSGVVPRMFAAIFAASHGFSTKLKGQKLIVTVKSTGTLTAQGRFLKPATRTGGPGKLAFRLRLKAKAHHRLAANGRLKLGVRLTFSPVGGVPLTKARTLKLRR
jgi:hypothetical protein